MSTGEIGQPADAGYTALQMAVAEGLSIHEMPREATAVLANINLYTTTAARPPGKLREFRRELEHTNALGTIAARVTEVMCQIPEYAEAAEGGTLGSRLAETFGAITEIKAKNVYIPNPQMQDNRVVDGMVLAKHMIFYVPTAEVADLLGITLQGLLFSRKRFYPVKTHPGNGDRAPMVLVGGLNEHTVRAIGRAVGAVVEVEDRAAGIILPPDKIPSVAWKQRGETFPPERDQRLETADLAYQSLIKIADYPGYPRMRPLTRDHPHLLGTDAAAVFQGMRDIMNPLIWETRGKRKNPEQDPDKSARLFIEEGIELTRHPSNPGDLGPPRSRILTVREKLHARRQSAVEQTKEAPVRAIFHGLSKVVRGLAKFIGVGTLDLSLSLLIRAPAFTQKGQKFAADARTWRQQKQAVAATDLLIAYHSAWHDRFGPSAE